MKISIQGHPTRGKEVIQILESLGGINIERLTGTYKTFYYINHKNKINDVPKLLLPPTHKCYTLEEFEKEFPFKIGDIVLLKVVNRPYEIIALEEYMNKLCYKLDNGLHCEPKTLTTYEKMKKERNITLTLDKANEWYKKGGELREVALQAFNEKELNPLPRSWREFCEQSYQPFFWIMPTKYEALCKLELLRDCWRQGWKPGRDIYHNGIYRYNGELIVGMVTTVSHFLTFPTKEMTKEFFECFKDLIEQAKDLI